MAFMIPQYEQATEREPWGTYEFQCETEILPPGTWPDRPVLDCTRSEVHRSGYFARLSAPGYLDCTDWAGPFETLEEAREYIADTYDVDPDTGEEIEP